MAIGEESRPELQHHEKIFGETLRIQKILEARTKSFGIIFVQEPEAGEFFPLKIRIHFVVSRQRRKIIRLRAEPVCGKRPNQQTRRWLSNVKSAMRIEVSHQGAGLWNDRLWSPNGRSHGFSSRRQSQGRSSFGLRLLKSCILTLRESIS